MKGNEYSHKPLLTKREREVFELLVQDKTTKEIASELFISEKTVRNHISNVMWFVGINKVPKFLKHLKSFVMLKTSNRLFDTHSINPLFRL
ncbi:helix-turn-helix transcriptional regulator [Bacillus sp. REN3]|uniref:helix-turn-helix domain-containing protein n=1 Tax=Bacillus sp. REN3 TaxID=2802440 RepID=UPI001AEEB9CD|nr:helix-turn-helix transcriptional regulator [Bacillus sp. REN3]